MDLEKKLNVIKEEFTKKHIEIKEVNLKKISSGISAGMYLMMCSIWKNHAISL